MLAAKLDKMIKKKMANHTSNYRNQLKEFYCKCGGLLRLCPGSRCASDAI